MNARNAHTLLCLASYEKGDEFLKEAKRQGCFVIFLTITELQHSEFWPRESIDEFYAMPDLTNIPDVVNSVSYLARRVRIDRVVAVDEYDTYTAAALREHLQLPGMGQTLARGFRDKLAMRRRTLAAGIPVPEFSGVFNNDQVEHFMSRVPTPLLLKPRSEATAIGIARIDSPVDVWPRLENLGDRRSHFLLERFVPGEIYHADSIIRGGEVLFAETHKYGIPPMQVFHTGGVAMTRTLPRGSADDRAVRAMNERVIDALEMEHGVTHMEFIKAEDGTFYFLEVGPRVGGAFTNEMVEISSGLNLYHEWAKLEAQGDAYRLPEHHQQYSGVLLCLAKQAHPDTSSYTESEIISRIDKRHHVVFLFASDDPERIPALQNEYAPRVQRDFMAQMPALEERPHS